MTIDVRDSLRIKFWPSVWNHAVHDRTLSFGSHSPRAKERTPWQTRSLAQTDLRAAHRAHHRSDSNRHECPEADYAFQVSMLRMWADSADSIERLAGKYKKGLEETEQP
jgi:hypothetical protein